MTRWLIVLAIALSSCGPVKYRATTGSIALLTPPYQRFVPPIYDPYGHVIGPDHEGFPVLGLWGTGLAQMTAVRFTLNCPPDGLPPDHHFARMVYTGSWPLALIPGDSLRGDLSRVELADDPRTPAPFPDSLGQFLGGSFALAVDADTLTGYVGVQYVGRCACLPSMGVRLVRE